MTDDQIDKAIGEMLRAGKGRFTPAEFNRAIFRLGATSAEAPGIAAICELDGCAMLRKAPRALRRGA